MQQHPSSGNNQTRPNHPKATPFSVILAQRRQLIEANDALRRQRDAESSSATRRQQEVQEKVQLGQGREKNAQVQQKIEREKQELLRREQEKERQKELEKSRMINIQNMEQQQRYVKWQWKSSISRNDSDESAWTDYKVDQSQKIEQAFSDKKGVNILNNDYAIEFTDIEADRVLEKCPDVMLHSRGQVQRKNSSNRRNIRRIVYLVESVKQPQQQCLEKDAAPSKENHQHQQTDQRQQHHQRQYQNDQTNNIENNNRDRENDAAPHHRMRTSSLIIQVTQQQRKLLPSKPKFKAPRNRTTGKLAPKPSILDKMRYGNHVASRRQRESDAEPSSSDPNPPPPHHVMVHPVFLQRIFSFVASGRHSATPQKPGRELRVTRSDAPFALASVSSCFLHTIEQFSGAEVCWLSFASVGIIRRVDGRRQVDTVEYFASVLLRALTKMSGQIALQALKVALSSGRDSTRRDELMNPPLFPMLNRATCERIINIVETRAGRISFSRTIQRQSMLAIAVANIRIGKEELQEMIEVMINLRGTEYLIEEQMSINVLLGLIDRDRQIKNITDEIVKLEGTSDPIIDSLTRRLLDAEEALPGVLSTVCEKMVELEIFDRICYELWTLFRDSRETSFDLIADQHISTKFSNTYLIYWVVKQEEEKRKAILRSEVFQRNEVVSGRDNPQVPRLVQQLLQVAAAPRRHPPPPPPLGGIKRVPKMPHSISSSNVTTVKLPPSSGPVPTSTAIYIQPPPPRSTRHNNPWGGKSFLGPGRATMPPPPRPLVPRPGNTNSTINRGSVPNPAPLPRPNLNSRTAATAATTHTRPSAARFYIPRAEEHDLEADDSDDSRDENDEYEEDEEEEEDDDDWEDAAPTRESGADDEDTVEEENPKVDGGDEHEDGAQKEELEDDRRNDEEEEEEEEQEDPLREDAAVEAASVAASDEYKLEFDDIEEANDDDESSDDDDYYCDDDDDDAADSLKGACVSNDGAAVKELCVYLAKQEITYGGQTNQFEVEFQKLSSENQQKLRALTSKKFMDDLIMYGSNPNPPPNLEKEGSNGLIDREEDILITAVTGDIQHKAVEIKQEAEEEEAMDAAHQYNSWVENSSPEGEHAEVKQEVIEEDYDHKEDEDDDIVILLRDSITDNSENIFVHEDAASSPQHSQILLDDDSTLLFPQIRRSRVSDYYVSSDGENRNQQQKSRSTRASTTYNNNNNDSSKVTLYGNNMLIDDEDDNNDETRLLPPPQEEQISVSKDDDAAPLSQYNSPANDNNNNATGARSAVDCPPNILLDDD